MSCNILVLNIGSTSFKFKLYNMPLKTVIASGKIDSVFSESSNYVFYRDNIKTEGSLDTRGGYSDCIKKAVSFVCENEKIDAIGFKTVMAGNVNYTCELTEDVLDKMQEYISVAPAHNIPYIKAVREIKKTFPEVPCIGSFETAFHRTIPEQAYMYPIDRSVAEKYGIRKYGFHGAAHGYAAYKLGKENSRLISVHLGGSSSVCAIKDGKSIDTSMGFSPQSGLPMNNRCGDIDAFALLYLMEKMNMNFSRSREFLSTKCGLLGMSLKSGDMRELEKETDKAAVNAFIYSCTKYISSFLPCLGGLDAVSFSGGIGENSSFVRQKICDGLKFLGLETDSKKNTEKAESEPLLISAENSKVKVYITPVNEEFTVALNIYRFLKGEQNV